jgi:hypothetical protein
VLAFFIGLAAASQSCAAAIELNFIAPNGQTADHFENDGREIKMEGRDGVVAIPPEGRWELRGDLKSIAAKIVWSPACSVGRLTRWQHAPGGQAPCRALVTLNAGAPGSWGVDQVKGGIAVFVWLRQGRAVAVAPVPIRAAYIAKDEVIAAARFELSEADAQGAPIVLLLRSNLFVTPNAVPWAEPTRAILAEAFLAVREKADAASVASVPVTEIGRLLELAANAGHGRLAAALLERHAAALNAEQCFQIFAAAGRGGRIELAAQILAAVGSRIPPRKLGEFLEELLVNGQDQLASETIAWMHRSDRKVPGADELARIALQRGHPKSTAALAGAALPQLIAKEGAAFFSGIAAVDNAELLRLLLANGIKPARVDPDSLALGQAAAVGDREKVSLLLAAGANVDPAHETATASLLHAVRGGHAEVIAALVAAGAKVDRLNPLGAVTVAAANAKAPTTTENVLALEVALLRHDRAAAEILTGAGARIDRRRPRFATLLEAAIAIDLPAIVETAVRDGWTPAQPLVGDWNLETVAAAYGAERCLAWLREHAPAPTPPITFYSNLEKRPELLTPEPEADLRASDRPHPRVEVTVRGAVDPTGALRCVTVEGTPDEELRVGLRSAAANLKFRPARRNGATVYVRISLPLVFAAIARRDFTANDVDLPALQTKPAIALARIMDAGGSNAGPGAGSDFDSLGGGDNLRDLKGDQLPLVRFTVDREGVPRDAVVVWSRDRLDADAALKSIAKYRFAPAIAGGRTVSVTLTQRIAPL